MEIDLDREYSRIRLLCSIIVVVKTRIAIISPYAKTIASFRGHLIKELVAHGCNVFVLAPDYDDFTLEQVRSLGADPITYKLDRTTLNIFKNFASFFEVRRLLLRLKPDVVFGYNHKPVMLAAMAGRSSGGKRLIGMIEGLGFAFTPSSEQLLKRKVAKFMLVSAYRIALPRLDYVILLNSDDMKDLSRLGLLNKDKALVLGGIGLDLDEWAFLPAHLEPITFTMVGRLIKEKGVLEFVKASMLVKEKYPETKFMLLGGVDQGPNAVSRYDLERWVAEGWIEWPGRVDNIKDYLGRTSVFVLPSYYREGVPRSTQEAMALGRPIITTNVAGCRETVEDGFNGFLVPPKDPNALAEAMIRLIENPSLIVEMGVNSRKLAEERYDIKKTDGILIKLLLGVD